jgi:hypothetical protein
MKHARSLFPWLLRGVDFDNDSAFMNDVVVPWCREQKLEVTRSRAYKKNDQAFVEQKNGAVVRRLMGYGRFDGVETARVMARLYAAARLYVNLFQPSFKLKEKRNLPSCFFLSTSLSASSYWSSNLLGSKCPALVFTIKQEDRCSIACCSGRRPRRAQPAPRRFAPSTFGFDFR